MKINVKKENDELQCRFIEEDGKQSNFSYVTFVDYIYKNGLDSVIIEYDESVLKDEKEKIELMYKTIKDKLSEESSELEVIRN